MGDPSYLLSAEHRQRPIPATFAQWSPSRCQFIRDAERDGLTFRQSVREPSLRGIGNLLFRQPDTCAYQVMCVKDVWCFVDGSDSENSELFATRFQDALFGDTGG